MSENRSDLMLPALISVGDYVVVCRDTALGRGQIPGTQHLFRPAWSPGVSQQVFGSEESAKQALRTVAKDRWPTVLKVVHQEMPELPKAKQEAEDRRALELELEELREQVRKLREEAGYEHEGAVKELRLLESLSARSGRDGLSVDYDADRELVQIIEGCPAGWRRLGRLPGTVVFDPSKSGELYWLRFYLVPVDKQDSHGSYKGDWVPHPSETTDWDAFNWVIGQYDWCQGERVLVTLEPRRARETR